MFESDAAQRLLDFGAGATMNGLRSFTAVLQLRRSFSDLSLSDEDSPSVLVTVVSEKHVVGYGNEIKSILK